MDKICGEYRTGRYAKRTAKTANPKLPQGDWVITLFVSSSLLSYETLTKGECVITHFIKVPEAFNQNENIIPKNIMLGRRL